jgi:hypothetical protein
VRSRTQAQPHSCACASCGRAQVRGDALAGLAQLRLAAGDWAGGEELLGAGLAAAEGERRAPPRPIPPRPADRLTPPRPADCATPHRTALSCPAAPPHCPAEAACARLTAPPSPPPPSGPLCSRGGRALAAAGAAAHAAGLLLCALLAGYPGRGPVPRGRQAVGAGAWPGKGKGGPWGTRAVLVAVCSQDACIYARVGRRRSRAGPGRARGKGGRAGGGARYAR